jgi:putative hemolysin
VIALQAPLVLALIVVAVLTAGGVTVRSVSRIWLRHWAERRLRGSGAAVAYLERPQRLLAAAGTGVATTLLFAGIVIGSNTDGTATVSSVIAFTLLTILFGQLIPRAIARRWPSVLAPVLLVALEITDFLTTPFARFGAWIAGVLDPRHSSDTARPAERDAIQDLLREGELEGIGESGEIRIISGVVKFTEKRVADVMTPRADIFALSADTLPLELARQVAASAYSRVPIHSGSLDDVTGMVHVFDVLKAEGETFPPVRRVMHAAPEAPCNELLFRMLRERQHLAIVRDAESRVVGLVTLEDMIEELVGDIRDEHDEPDGSRGSAP